MKRNHVWVVETYIVSKAIWMPRNGSSRSTRREGRKAKYVAQMFQPKEKHRLRKYTAEQSTGGS